MKTQSRSGVAKKKVSRRKVLAALVLSAAGVAAEGVARAQSDLAPAAKGKARPAKTAQKPAAAPVSLKRSDLVGEWQYNGGSAAQCARTILRADGTALYISGPLDPMIQPMGKGEERWNYIRPAHPASPDDHWRFIMPGVWRYVDGRHFVIVTQILPDPDHLPEGDLESETNEIVSYDPEKQQMLLRLIHSPDVDAGLHPDDALWTKVPAKSPGGTGTHP